MTARPDHIMVSREVIETVAAKLEVDSDFLMELVMAPEGEWRRSRVLDPSYERADKAKRRRSHLPKDHKFVHPSEHYRPLWIPSVALMRVLRKLNEVYFSRLSMHPACHGFVPQRSVRSKARVHRASGLQYQLRLDVYKAFGQIGKEQVVPFLMRALQLSREEAKVIARLCVWHGSLPQGAPTSPILFAAMIGRALNRILFAVPKQNKERSLRIIFGKLEVTVYADDIVFSQDRPFESWMIHALFIFFQAEGLPLNWNKIRVGGLKHGAIGLPGTILQLKEGKPDVGVSRKMVKQVRAALRKGLDGEISPAEVWELFGYVYWIYGKNTSRLPSAIRELAREWLKQIRVAKSA